MQTIQVEYKDGYYSCDIGISKDEWLEILQDEKTPQTYKETVLRFFYYPERRGTCTAVSNSFGGNAQELNANIRELGRYVQKRLNRFQAIRPNGTPCFWIIPMCEGKKLPQGGDGIFEWELRPELVDAVREYLYCHLIEQYKELRKEIPIDGNEWTELYKWQLITASKGKTPFEIIRSHVANPNKSELGGFDNLIDAARDNKTLKHLVDTNPDGLHKALDTLIDETKPLNERLANYKLAMASLLPTTGFNSKANDERTASVILTCVNPEKHTIYKYDVYTLFCKYLGEEKKSAGQCYHHFLELIEPLRQLAALDKELHQIVAPSLDGQIKSDLLLAQDILWMSLIEFPKTLGYIRDIMLPTKQRVWLWSGDVNTYLQDSLGCGSSAKTIKDFTIYKSKSAMRKAYQQDVGNTDLKIPDAYWSFSKEVSVGDIVVVFEPKKGNGKQYHLLHGWGLFTSDCTIVEDDENPMRREVEWHSFLQIPVQNTEMGNSIFFQGTTDKQALHVKELLNINTEKEMESKYQKYIDLLKANKNLILTGAPGTGKTHMARNIAKDFILSNVSLYKDYKKDDGFEGITEVEEVYNRVLEDYCMMVQFHPSLDYTDFVEGLRPVKNHNSQLGFERKNGVFKDFCERALSFAVTKRKKDGTIIQNDVTMSGCYDLYNDCYDAAIQRLKQYHSLLTSDGELYDFSVQDNSIVFDSIQWIDNSSDSFHLFYDCARKSDYDVFTEEWPQGKAEIEKELKNLIESGLVNNLKKNNCSDADLSKVAESYWLLFVWIYEYAKHNFERIHLPTVFIIDEINRGEISKIFGELFFSIDPGYRGEYDRNGHDNKVQTQYQNLIGDDDVFKKGFYVPENVYIIGTMNDIDRSVESMDFAMRRRFAWQEVTAEESYENMIENEPEFALVKDEIKQRMFRLNKAIAETEGLDEAYQIGAAYFRKYLDYQDKENPFDCLWNNHLKGLLFEYLRGNRRAKELLEKLHKAYNKTNIDEQPAHTNEG